MVLEWAVKRLVSAVMKYKALLRELDKTEDLAALSKKSEASLRLANARIFNFLPHCPEDAHTVMQGMRTKTVAHDCMQKVLVLIGAYELFASEEVSPPPPHTHTHTSSIRHAFAP